jgi:hypothetical protein
VSEELHSAQSDVLLLLVLLVLLPLEPVLKVLLLLLLLLLASVEACAAYQQAGAGRVGFNREVG